MIEVKLMTIRALSALFLAGTLFVAPSAMAQTADQPRDKETSCDNGKDDDGDGLADCGDADCEKDPACQPDGNPENTNARCSDWIDNDNDGHVDCDDTDCDGPLVTACKGSWKAPVGGGQTATVTPAASDVPELGAGQSVEDLIGTGSDKDGERNDFLCSDGVDNDNDGAVDCADFGCRFDPAVRVCHGNPGMRFSIVANVAAAYDIENDQPDVLFSKLQLRSFGPIPLIQDSFYLLSMRAEKTPRLTFAMFQVPIAKGHFVNVNSGGGGLSRQAVLSSAKNLLLDPAFYLTNAFEQGNSAAVEFSGPLGGGGIARYRAYAAGGAGFFNGNVGGRFFDFDDTNFTWGVGAAVLFNAIGSFSEWDSQFTYTKATHTLAFKIGGKYDQRSLERYGAVNVAAYWRWKWFSLAAENYTKRELEFRSWQTAYNVRLGILIVPKHLMLGADFGEFIAGEPDFEFDTSDRELRRQLNEQQWRVALHWFWFRNIGVASVLYTDREVEPSTVGQVDPDREREIRLEVQYRF